MNSQLTLKGGTLVAKVSDRITEQLIRALASANNANFYDLEVKKSYPNDSKIEGIKVRNEMAGNRSKLYVATDSGEEVLECIFSPRGSGGPSAHLALVEAFGETPVVLSVRKPVSRIESPITRKILQGLVDAFGSAEFPQQEMVKRVRQLARGRKRAGLIANLSKYGHLIRNGAQMRVSERARELLTVPAPAPVTKKRGSGRKTSNLPRNYQPRFNLEEIAGELRKKFGVKEFTVTELLREMRVACPEAKGSFGLGGIIGWLTRKNFLVVVRGTKNERVLRVGTKVAPPPRVIKLFPAAVGSSPQLMDRIRFLREQSLRYEALVKEAEELKPFHDELQQLKSLLH